MAWFSGSEAVGQGPPGEQETRCNATAGPFFPLISHGTMIA